MGHGCVPGAPLGHGRTSFIGTPSAFIEASTPAQHASWISCQHPCTARTQGPSSELSQDSPRGCAPSHCTRARAPALLAYDTSPPADALAFAHVQCAAAGECVDQDGVGELVGDQALGVRGTLDDQDRVQTAQRMQGKI